MHIWCVTKMCCKNDKFSNCNDLFYSQLLNFFCLSIGILSVILNIISIFIYINSLSKLMTNDLFALCLSLFDCLLGIYLLIISSADWYLRGHYVGSEHSWKGSLTCEISSFIVLVCVITSPIILADIMLGRFCVIQRPITSRFKNITFTIRLITVTIFVIVSSCLFIVIYFYYVLDLKVPSGICFLLYTESRQSSLLKLISSAVISLQIVSLVSNFTLGIFLIYSLTKFKCVTANVSTQIRNKEVTKNVLFMTSANMCCWIPSSIVFLLPFIGHAISNIVRAWIIVVIIPINSVLNPVLFTLLTPNRRRQMSKFFFKLTAKSLTFIG